MIWVQKCKSQAFPLPVPRAAALHCIGLLKMLQGGAGSECCCLAWHHIRQYTLGKKKKKKRGRKEEKGRGCPSDSEIVPPMAEVASLMLCWSPGQIPQPLLDSFSDQFPLHSAEAPFGSSQQELPPLRLGICRRKQSKQSDMWGKLFKSPQNVTPQFWQVTCHPLFSAKLNMSGHYLPSQGQCSGSVPVVVIPGI